MQRAIEAPPIPAALLTATTIVALAGWGAGGLPVPLLPTIGVLSVLCWPLFRNRSALWGWMGEQTVGEVVPLVPSLVFLGVVVGSHATAVPNVPGGLGIALLTFVFGAWLLHSVKKRYISEKVSGQTAFATWKAGPPRRRKIKKIGFSAVGSALFAISLGAVLGLSSYAGIDTVTIENLLAEGLPAAVGSVLGASLVSPVIDTASTYTAFEHGIKVGNHRFISHEAITGYTLTDRKLVIETEGWFGDQHLDRDDIENVDQVRSVLDKYETMHVQWEPNYRTQTVSTGR